MEATTASASDLLWGNYTHHRPDWASTGHERPGIHDGGRLPWNEVCYGHSSNVLHEHVSIYISRDDGITNVLGNFGLLSGQHALLTPWGHFLPWSLLRSESLVRHVVERQNQKTYLMVLRLNIRRVSESWGVGLDDPFGRFHIRR